MGPWESQRSVSHTLCAYNPSRISLKGNLMSSRSGVAPKGLHSKKCPGKVSAAGLATIVLAVTLQFSKSQGLLRIKKKTKQNPDCKPPSRVTNLESLEFRAHGTYGFVYDT